MKAEHELVNLRAVAMGHAPELPAIEARRMIASTRASSSRTPTGFTT